MSEVFHQEKKPLVSVKAELKARRKFSSLLRRLDPENQDFLSEMTSVLTEPDIYNQSKSSLDWVDGLHRALSKRKLNEKQIKVVFDYFNLPFTKKS